MLDPHRNPRQLASRRPEKSRDGRRPLAPNRGPAPWLALTCGVLILLIVLGRFRREPTAPATAAAQPAQESAATQPATGAELSQAERPAPAALSPMEAAPAAPATPALDLLVRLEARRRIQRAGRAVYLDSLLAESDSTLRRWPERPGQAVTIALIRDSAYGGVPAADAIVREALATWQALPLGVEFAFVADTAAAEVVIGWRDRFDPEEQRTGQTDLDVTGEGVITRARVSLARRAPDGRLLDRQAMLITAAHEFGHVVGLAHSALASDLMFPTPRSPRLSDRDRQTALLIYGLPPGSVKGQ